MIGIDKFKEYFTDYKEEYVIIGGAACELLMQEVERPFRATKDIDIVLIVDSLTKEFALKFWEFIQDAGYENINKATGDKQFYRFSHPKSAEYPLMIELFSKKSEWMPSELETRYTPIFIDESVSSLSAILLNDEYYDFLKNSIINIDGLSVLKADCIIPFKVKAWIDLIQRKNSGQQVDGTNIKKHKNDVFRLSVLLTPNKNIVLPKAIKKDMSFFLEEMEKDINLLQLDIKGINQTQVLEMLYKYFIINEDTKS